MGLFKNKEQRQIDKQMKVLTNAFKVLQGYVPMFSSYDGGVYEMELTRSAIESIALHCSKLNPVITGTKYKKLNKIIQTQPNYLMTTSQFLEKLVTILLVENNAYIIPIYSDRFATDIVGFYPVRSAGSRLVRDNGIEYLTYKIGDKNYAIEYERVGHLRRHYYKKEYSGESNQALNTTLDLMNAQNIGIKEGIKSGASIRFLARLVNVMMPEDMKKERERLTADNLTTENSGGVMIFDNRYADIKPIDSKPFIVDDKQAELIKQNVFNYFHISESIIQNKASEDEFANFYEGCIEPIATQISQVLTRMIMTHKEIERGYSVMLESTKLQFASNNTKLSVSTQLFDRGVLTTNQIMDLWNLPHVEDGDKRYIRKEYCEITKLDDVAQSAPILVEPIKATDPVKEDETDEQGSSNGQDNPSGNSNSNSKDGESQNTDTKEEN